MMVDAREIPEAKFADLTEKEQNFLRLFLSAWMITAVKRHGSFRKLTQDHGVDFVERSMLALYDAGDIQLGCAPNDFGTEIVLLLYDPAREGYFPV